MKQRNKKVGLFTIALVMLMGTFGCKGGKTTTIVNRTDSESQKIKYSGQIVFTKDGAGIEHISDGGYLEFEQNGREFKAEEDKKGHITYAFNGDSKITTLSNEQQAFVATAIKQIVKTKAKL
ncbi:hypothetical protein [Mucilaginibacter phyllosphaerae]|uniref:Uncharacterized protein n=1 Tax=Mucilaginibacter phyllosphaerae TaxID=1812349 RepID=A0A4Y8AJ13_9SPHI|nr:hypothetical protein [Mucilaginibacter phyllosphaerae]MBB3967925.1 hypothetical protein [Mucilaginibacter phyllosphaerae]TEW69036.1 hypothetical protein E2R65_02405 [Mucilaginibacter phyllosphaerae]GGH02375.1 hypothetical protein GCM10007352_04590 [Mucilaginibacter phyllosphaerae]